MNEEAKTEAAKAVGITALIAGTALIIGAYHDMRKARKAYDNKRTHLELTINMMERMRDLCEDPEMTEEIFDAKLAEEKAFIDIVVQNQK